MFCQKCFHPFWQHMTKQCFFLLAGISSMKSIIRCSNGWSGGGCAPWCCGLSLPVICVANSIHAWQHCAKAAKPLKFICLHLSFLLLTHDQACVNLAKWGENDWASNVCHLVPSNCRPSSERHWDTQALSCKKGLASPDSPPLLPLCIAKTHCTTHRPRAQKTKTRNKLTSHKTQISNLNDS